MKRLSLWVSLAAIAAAGCGADSSGVDIEAFVCTDEGTFTIEEANERGYDAAYRGKCGEPMECGTVWDCFAGDECRPMDDVVGSVAEKTTLAPPHICIPGPWHCRCPGVLAPVCGSDGLTYINECEAACVGVGIVHDGHCEDMPCDVRPLQEGFTATCESEQYPGIEGVISAEPLEPLALGRPFAGLFEVVEPPLGFVVEGEATLFCEDGELSAIGSAHTPIGFLEVTCWDIRPLDDERPCTRDEDCPPGELCAFRDIACTPDEPCPLDASSDQPVSYPAVGVCEPCACPEIYAPVCGVDGQTYGNACEARCAHVEIAHEGECEACPPTHVKRPDGRCVPKCYGDEQCRPGKICNAPWVCLQDPACPACDVCVGWCEPCVCPAIYDPVCGVDGKTYGNTCEASCARVEIAYEGVCRDDCRTAGCPSGWTCDYCDGAWECLPPEAGACPSPDCRVTGCDAGYECIVCWSGYACVPKGAIC